MSAVVAANSLGENSSISLLLAGSGSSLQEAASQAASCHPSVSEVNYNILASVHVLSFGFVVLMLVLFFRYLLLILINLSTL